MKKAQFVVTAACLLCAVAVAQAQTVSWKQMPGIILVGNVVGTGTGAVPGGFLPWTTTSGAARVNLRSGTLQFVVRGLVFAAGGRGITIGTPGPLTGVRGTLVCDVDGSASGGNSVLVNTPLLPLSPTGDASFRGHVDLPAVCSTESDIAFLVTAARFGTTEVPAGPWIANGAVLMMNSDDHGQH